MSARVPAIVVGVGVVAALAYALLRSRDGGSSGSGGGATTTTTPAGAGAANATDGASARSPGILRAGSDGTANRAGTPGDDGVRPALPPAVVADPGRSGAFEAEGRDRTWAPATEAELRRRADGLLALTGNGSGAVLHRLECRTSQCRLALSGTDRAVFEKIVEAAQDERGFLGWANQLALERLERSATGTASIWMYLEFDRHEDAP